MMKVETRMLGKLLDLSLRLSWSAIMVSSHKGLRSMVRSRVDSTPGMARLLCLYYILGS